MSDHQGSEGGARMKVKGDIADEFCGQPQAHGSHPWQGRVPYGSTQIVMVRQCAGTTGAAPDEG